MQKENTGLPEKEVEEILKWCKEWGIKIPPESRNVTGERTKNNETVQNSREQRTGQEINFY